MAASLEHRERVLKHLEGAAMAMLTKGQASFLKAVRERSDGLFHKRVVDPVERLGLVRWIGGMRLIGCNSFSARNFVCSMPIGLTPTAPTDSGKTHV